MVDEPYNQTKPNQIRGNLFALYFAVGKPMKHESDGSNNRCGDTLIECPNVGKETGKTEGQRKNRDHPDHSPV